MAAKGFILGTDVSQARLQLEKPSISHPNQGRAVEGRATRKASVVRKNVVIKDTPTNRDIAEHGAKRLFSAVMGCLHNGRDKGKTAFAEELGYLMVDWDSHKTDADQSALTIEWAYSDEIQSDRSTASVEKTLVPKDDLSAVACDKTNAERLMDLYSKRKDMILMIEHEVSVVSKCNVLRKRQGGETRTLRRAINICETAARFLVEFTQCGNEEAFLRSHESALKSVVCVAVVFRKLVSAFLAGAKDCDQELIKPGQLDLGAVTCGHLALSDFLPGYSVMKRTLDSKSLRMNEAEFAKPNIYDLRSRTDFQAGKDDIDPKGTEIVASAASGVILM